MSSICLLFLLSRLTSSKVGALVAQYSAVGGRGRRCGVLAVLSVVSLAVLALGLVCSGSEVQVVVGAVVKVGGPRKREGTKP